MIAFLTAAIRTSMVFLFGSTGEILTEKSGHLNLGIPGIMCVGSAFGCSTIYWYASAVGKPNVDHVLIVLLPILAAFIGGLLMGLIYCFLTVTLHANQNVTGLILTTLGVGITDYMISKIKGFAFAAKYFTSSLPFASSLGWFGKLFLSYGVMIYLALAIAIITAFILRKTKIGLHLRAVGENPATADAVGINVTLYRYVATCLGCGISALGGLCYVMDNNFGGWSESSFVEAVGWLAVALVIFSVWKPDIAIIGSIIFGALYNAPSYIKNISFAGKDIVKMLPYVVTVIVLIITSIRNKPENQPPAGLGINYFREER